MGIEAVTERSNKSLSEQSVLGRHAPRTQRRGDSLPFNDELHLQAHKWLVDESYLLDAQEYDE